MKASSRTNPFVSPRVGSGLMRGLWIGLTAVHAPILARLTAEVVLGTAGPDRVAAWLAVLATSGVFAYLALRQDSRRCRYGAGRLWLLCLATAIAHRGALGLDQVDPMVPVAVVTTVVMGERLWRPGRRFLRKLRSRLAAATHRVRGAGVIAWLRHEANRVRCVSVARANAPRAPPGAVVPA